MTEIYVVNTPKLVEYGICKLFLDFVELAPIAIPSLPLIILPWRVSSRECSWDSVGLIRTYATIHFTLSSFEYCVDYYAEKMMRQPPADIRKIA